MQRTEMRSPLFELRPYGCQVLLDPVVVVVHILIAEAIS
jgi:hypothetical protein